MIVNSDKYVLDLRSKRPEVLLYERETILEDLEEHGASSIEELADYDWKIFQTVQDAEDYLKKYLSVLDTLDNSKICKSRQLPGMLYKRRYLVQSLMREKLQTYRHYKKNWSTGQLFNLNDQTYFLTVRLLSLSFENSQYCYKFDLA